MITLTHYMLLSAVLFTIGLFGVLSKKNAIAVLVSTEIMLNAVNLNLIAINKYIGVDGFYGQLMALFVIAVAAAEVGVGLGIIISMYRNKETISLDDFNFLKW
ncbi:NADH-quinone oxidoreductase subunit NuoK [Carboxydothermus pertinax]|uniref:NADH-quinone oxidoreductase subunit K n=1 Tax=Carboxydothermus pertinax TaxID=870242 RepID=A0A1L8CXR1_9THEO|nr:NADH-quinone oxidoreductase subunit NuoK [Carboxydothermus pertinax]GAV23661.1 NADH-quinone oxidoreductase subunit K [Carboxydothermus pertinax]